MRPGPDRLAPGLAPGGVVIHVYDAAGVLVLQQRITRESDVEFLAKAGGMATADRVDDGAPIVLVTYDGDTGDRFCIGRPGDRYVP